MGEKTQLLKLAGTQRVYVEEAGDVIAVVEALANPGLRGAIITVKAGRSVDIASLGHCLIGHGLSLLVQQALLDREQSVAIQDMIADQTNTVWEEEANDRDFPF